MHMIDTVWISFKNKIKMKTTRFSSEINYLRLIDKAERDLWEL